MRLSTMVARSAAAAAFAGGLMLLGATPAHALSTIPINPGNVPTTAAGFGSQDCVQTGSSPTLDGWVFVLPGNKGTFVSLTLTFATSGGPVQLVIPTDGGAIGTGGGANKAWISTPAGWTLIAASAVINGQSNGFFVLTHTCPATSTPSPPPSTEPPTTPPSTPPTSESSSSSAAGLRVAAGGSSLGAAVGLLVGGGLISTGTVLLMRRRRDRLG
ncbi:MAG TPA: hypothetical protein VHI50_02510 [Micromonosporaceae bacterium]|nr:hypothetical protein [Micromonosporaceae bacterium]